MDKPDELPAKLMLLVSAIQGIALLFLWDASESGTWPSQSPLWHFPMWVLALAVPALFLASLESGLEKRAAGYIAAFALVLVIVSVYVGWQASPHGEFPIGNLTFVFAASMGLGCFKALMYIQQRVSRKPMSYDVLFGYSWRNFLTLTLSAVLTFVFWLLLLLWGELFRAIKIDFFHDLFEQDWFLFPVLSLAFGVGVIIFRNLVRVIDSITRLLQGLIKILLPLAAVVSVVFLSALPFVGLDALWATGSGTSLLLWLLAVMLFFTNAVYQDGRGEQPYPLLVHRILYVALLTTPIISVLSFYGLYLRLEEYGWTVVRGWAFVVWLVLSLFSVGYVVGIVRKRDAWTLDLARVNTAMGLVVMVLMLALNSPLLDLRKLSLGSQLARVESAKLLIEDFDFWYAKQSLGRPGYLFMQELIAEIGDSDPELLVKVEEPSYRNIYAANALDADAFIDRLTYRPEDLEVPDELLAAIRSSHTSMGEGVEPFLIRTDMDSDQVNEYVLLYFQLGAVYSGRVYYNDGEGWMSLNLLSHDRSAQGPNQRENIANGAISLLPHRFDMLQIGEKVFRAAEND